MVTAKKLTDCICAGFTWQLSPTDHCFRLSMICVAFLLLGTAKTPCFGGAFPKADTLDTAFVHKGWTNLIGPQVGPPFLDVLHIGSKKKWGWIVVKSDPDGDTIAEDITVVGFHLVNPHANEIRAALIFLGPIANVVPPGDAPLPAFPVTPAPVFILHPAAGHEDKLEVRINNVLVGGVPIRRLSIQLSHPDDDGNYPPTLNEDFGPQDPPTPSCAAAPCDDCNQNGISDAQDILDLTSNDCNGDGVPDECQSDCNDNGIGDQCEALGLPGACIFTSSQCFEMSQCECDAISGTFLGEGQNCAVPAVSEWGVAVLALLVMLGGTIIVGRQCRSSATSVASTD